MKLGRAQLTNGPTNKAGPASFVQNGDRVALTGTLYPAAATAGKSSDLSRAFRQQWLAMSAGDVVPLWFPDEREDIWDATGFYRVLSTGFEVLPAVTESQGVISYSASLERVPNGYAAALVEQYLTSTLRTNGQNITAGNQVVACPKSSYRSLTNMETVETATGDILVKSFDVESAHIDLMEYRTAPTDFYNGAPTIEAQYTPGGTWYPLDGLQATAAHQTDTVRLSNGLVRVIFEGGVGVHIEAFDSSFETVEWFDPITVSVANLVATAPVRIVTSTETVSTVELSTINGTFMVTLYRGSPFVFGAVADPSTDRVPYTVTRNGTVSNGEIVDGVVAELVPVDGRIWMFCAPDVNVSATVSLDGGTSGVEPTESVDGGTSGVTPTDFVDGGPAAAPGSPTSAGSDGVRELAMAVVPPADLARYTADYYGISLASQQVMS